jgi:enterobactin synthetase component D
MRPIELGISGVACVGVALPLDGRTIDGLQLEMPYQLRGASSQRKQEFLAGRMCVGAAAALLGLDLTYLPIGPGRGPTWPLGLTGSISHSKGLALACVGMIEKVRSIGIDTEELLSNETISNIKSTISHECEQQLIARIAAAFSEELAFTVLFSAKEALFKAVHPISQTFFDFKDATMTSLSLKDQTFSFEIHESVPLKGLANNFQGRFLTEGNTLISVLPIKN